MEFCEGGELFDYIVKHTRIKEPVAVRFFHQIIDGLDYLHKVNVIHRDLKPENLLMQRRPEGWHIKIVDFGLSNTNEGNKLLKTACGSPCYAAPEMIAGKRYHGPLADIWSVGVILFAMVCGYLPFEDNNTAHLYKKILRGSYKAPKFISSQVRDLIARILNTDPTKRYTTYDIRRHTWFGQGSRNGAKMTKAKKHVSPQKENNIQAAVATTSSHPAAKASSKADQVAKRNEMLATVDETVLRQMADLGFNSANVIDSLVTGKHNQITTAYQLLVTRKKKIQIAKQKRQEDLEQRKDIERKAAEEKKQRAAEKAKENAKIQSEIEKRKEQLKLQMQHNENVKQIVEKQAAKQGEEKNAMLKKAGTEENKAIKTIVPSKQVQAANNSAIPSKEDQVQKATAPPSRPAPPTSKPPIKSTGNSQQKVYAQRAGRKIVKTSTNSKNSSINAMRVANGQPLTRPAPPSSRPPPKTKQHATVQQGISLQPIGASSEKPKSPPSKPPRLSPKTKTDGDSDRQNGSVVDEMKTFHGVFDPLHTSTKLPETLMKEMKRVLNMNRVPYTASNPYAYTCQTKECRWKLEICKLEDVQKVYVIRRQRLAGDTYKYEITSKRCMEQMRL